MHLILSHAFKSGEEAASADAAVAQFNWGMNSGVMGLGGCERELALGGYASAILSHFTLYPT